MTEVTFKKAELLRNQIKHIDSILETYSIIANNHLGGGFSLDPPTKDAGISMFFSYGEEMTMPLNEGEVVLILKALVSEKERLQLEFGKL